MQLKKWGRLGKEKWEVGGTLFYKKKGGSQGDEVHMRKDPLLLLKKRESLRKIIQEEVFRHGKETK